MPTRLAFLIVPVLAAALLTAMPPPAANAAIPAAANGTALTGTGTVAASTLLAQLTVAPSAPAGYDRALFVHWIDSDGNGCDTRQEVLIAESLVPVVKGSGCTIVSGQWSSWYDGATWTNPSDVDIDHFVPLGEAWASGASHWTPQQRQDYANDLGNPASLVAVTDNVNSSKSDSDPTNWMPPLPGVACQYVVDWVAVKYRWNLSIDEAEQSVLGNQITGACGDPQLEVPAQMIAQSVAPTVERISGADRYDVAINLSLKNFVQGAPTIYIAKGTNYPDALSAAPAAAAAGGPLLLTLPTELPDKVRDEIERLNPSKIVVVGGVNSVSSSQFELLQTLAPDVLRIGGADRYEASRNLVDYAFGATGASRVYLATGQNFPDALAASSAAGARNGAVLLVPGYQTLLDAPTTALITRLNPTDAVIAGGTASVSTGIEAAVRSLGLPGGAMRLGGADRFVAALNINKEAFQIADTVYLATGFNYPDALAGGAIAGKAKAPLLLVPTSCVTQKIIDEIHALNPRRLVILGGTNSVTAAVASLTLCVTNPSIYVGYVCSPQPGFSMTATNPNDYAITVDFSVDSPASTVNGIAIPEGGTVVLGRSELGGIGEDTAARIHVKFQGVDVYAKTLSADCVAPPPPAPPAPPASPGDSKSCGDFATWSAAQAWFLTYLPYYGDIARLDGNNDGTACESLPGHP